MSSNTIYQRKNSENNFILNAQKIHDNRYDYIKNKESIIA